VNENKLPADEAVSVSTDAEIHNQGYETHDYNHKTATLNKNFGQ